MRKTTLFILLLTLIASVASAQRYAYVNTEYILNNIPSYKAAQEKLNQLSYEWQQELETKKAELNEMENEYQTEKVLLTDEMQQRRKNEIQEMKKNIQELQRKY